MEETPYQEQSNQGINIKAILGLVKAYWHLFIICLSVALIDAYLINRYTVPIYKVKSEVQLNNSQKGREGAEILGASGFSETFNQWDPTFVNDKISILKSKYFLTKVVKELELTKTFYNKGSIKTTQVYPKSLPFDLKFRIKSENAYRYTYHLFLNSNQFNLKIKLNDKVIVEKKNIAFNDSVNLQNLVLIVNGEPELLNNVKINQEVIFNLNSIKNVTESLANLVNVANIKNTKTLQITIDYPEVNMAKDILNAMAYNFVEKGLNDKNEKFDNSVVFINEQLLKIESELDNSEFNLEKFKQVNGFQDIPAESALLLSDKNNFEHIYK